MMKIIFVFLISYVLAGEKGPAVEGSDFMSNLSVLTKKCELSLNSLKIYFRRRKSI